MIKEKLYVRQICLLFGAFSLVGKLITLPAITSKYSKEALWVSALLNFLLDGSCFYYFTRLAKKFQGKTIYEIVQDNLGENFRRIFAFVYFAFFLLKSYLPTIEHRNFVEIALYETSPSLWIFLPAFLFSAFFSYKGLRAAGRCADAAVWFTVAGLVVVASLSLSASNFGNLLPLVDVPFKDVAKGSYLTSFWYFDSPYLLFCIGSFKPEKNQTKKFLAAYFGFAALALVYIAIFQSEFGPLAQRQFFAPIKMGKYAISVSNIGRIDYIAVFALIFSNTFNVGLPLLFATECLSRCFDFKHKIAPCLVVNCIAGLGVALTEKFYFVARDGFLRCAIPFFIFATALLPLVFLFFKKKETV